MFRIGSATYNAEVYDIIRHIQSTSRYFKKIKKIQGYTLVTCPYHKDGQENRPSAQVRDSDGLFYCFSCKAVHSLPQVIQHCLNVNGMKWLNEQFEVSRKTTLFKQAEKKQVSYVDLPSSLETKVEYLEGRGISPEVIDKFDIRYKDNTVLFPNKDENGNILFIATRRTDKKLFHYPNGVDKPLYGLYETKKYFPHTNELIIAESMINCLTSWSYGYPAIALNGTGSKKQIEQLKNLPYRKYILMLDPDEAGQKGTEKLKQIKNKLVYTTSIPKGKDVNDLTKSQFEQILKEATLCKSFIHF